MNLFIDTTNLYYNAKKRYNGIVDYEKLLDTINPSRVNTIYVYIARMSVKSDGFIKYMEGVVRHNEHVVRVKEPFPVKINGQVINMMDFKVELTIDVLNRRKEENIVFSSDFNLFPLIQEVPLEIRAINVPHEFREWAHVKEINEEFVRATTTAT